MDFVKAFIVGGIICLIAQIIIDKTKVTSAKIMVYFVCGGCILGGLGLYQPLVDFAEAGATVPLPGFGFALAKGVMTEVESYGLQGVLTGGLKATSAGITSAMLFGVLASLAFSPKDKK